MIQVPTPWKKSIAVRIPGMLPAVITSLKEFAPMPCQRNAIGERCGSIRYTHSTKLAMPPSAPGM